jgi:N-acetylglucosaminyldiphosphoundecaprenol N-acetyl-beta-D-mannosaminyltransferase
MLPEHAAAASFAFGVRLHDVLLRHELFAGSSCPSRMVGSDVTEESIDLSADGAPDPAGSDHTEPLSGIRTVTFAGLPVAALSLTEAAQAVMDAAAAKRAISVRLVNAYSVHLTTKSRAYRALLQDTVDAINFPDGRPLARAVQRRAGRTTQVRGPDLFERTLDLARAHGMRHYLLGGSAETLARLARELTSRYPGLTIAGMYSPPFRELTAEERSTQDDVIAASGADVVWVGLGTPKQDFEAARLARSCGIPAIAVGAAFDFSAGTKSVAPEWVRNTGFEWLFRLVSEPRRLWKRYLLGNASFARLWLAERRRE